MFALVNAHPTDRLTLSIGGRYSHDRKKYDIASQVLVNAVQTSAFDTSRKATWAAFTPRLPVEYELAPAAMVYANYSQGYQAGGRSEARRVGTVCVSACGSRWSPYH